MKQVFDKNAFLLLISLVLLFMGLTVSGATLLFAYRSKSVMPLMRLGLFALAAGTWGVGECNATLFLFPYPALLYCMAFGGLFVVTLPILQYGLDYLRPKNPLSLKVCVWTLRLAVAAAFGFQFAGKVALSKSMYGFHLMLPLSLIVFLLAAAWEYFKHRNPAAKKLVLPILILPVAAIIYEGTRPRSR